MILASGEGQVVFVVIMAILGLINWISKTLNSGDKKPPQNPSQSGRAAAPPRRANAESEEERMRRFLEALGLPADDKPAALRPRSEQRPVPPIVAPPPLPNAPRRSVRPATITPPAQKQRRSGLPEERPVPASRVETIALPELRVPPAPEFETISSKISAVSADFPATRDDVDRPRGPTIGETLRAALASPQQLRSAFILAEVFGTPPGLRQP